MSGNQQSRRSRQDSQVQQKVPLKQVFKINQVPNRKPPTRVGCNIVGIVVQNFTNSIYASGLGKVGPEVLSHMLDSINADTINSIVLDQVADPCVPCADHVLVLGIHIREWEIFVAKPALFDSGLIVVVVRGLDKTFRVEVGLLIEGRETAKVRWV